MTLDTYADLFETDLDEVAGDPGRARQDVYVLSERGRESQPPGLAAPQMHGCGW
jgi:hypothetical protein